MCEFQEKRNRKEFEQERQDKIEPKQTICHGEFDPGSGRTLAACLTHASRTKRRKELALFRIEWQTGE
jgi:hypothetical protein